MVERYYDIDQLGENEFFEFSSLTCISVLKKTHTENEALNLAQTFSERKPFFLALFYCAKFPIFCSLKEGPIPMLPRLSVKEFIIDPSYLFSCPHRRMSYYWAFMFDKVVKWLIASEEEALIVINDILTFLCHVDHLSYFSLMPKVYAFQDRYETQFICTFTEKPLINIQLPSVPSLKVRTTFDDVSRPEKLWNEKDFYTQHEKLVSEVWDELEQNEREAFLSFTREDEESGSKLL